MDFSEFDVKKIDEYEEQAKATWGNTPEYKSLFSFSTCAYCAVRFFAR